MINNPGAVALHGDVSMVKSQTYVRQGTCKTLHGTVWFAGTCVAAV